MLSSSCVWTPCILWDAAVQHAPCQMLDTCRHTGPLSQLLRDDASSSGVPAATKDIIGMVKAYKIFQIFVWCVQG